MIEATIAAGFTPVEARQFYEVLDGVPAVMERLAQLSRPPAGEAARL